jgi:hypothetical protein
VDNTAEEPAAEGDPATGRTPDPSAADVSDNADMGAADRQLDSLLNDLAQTCRGDFDLDRGLERLRSSHGELFPSLPTSM